MSKLVHGEVTEQILGVFFSVHHKLGYGFAEAVYQRALTLDLRKCGFEVACEVPIKVEYEGTIIGEYRADVVVDDKVLLELKAAQVIHHDHTAQLLNYLKGSHFEVGLLLNFGPQATFARRVSENAAKGAWLRKQR